MPDDRATLLQGLKAYAYDCISQMEHWQKQLAQTNAKIRELVEAPPEPLPDAPPKVKKPNGALTTRVE